MQVTCFDLVYFDFVIIYVNKILNTQTINKFSAQLFFKVVIFYIILSMLCRQTKKNYK